MPDGKRKCKTQEREKKNRKKVKPKKKIARKSATKSQYAFVGILTSMLERKKDIQNIIIKKSIAEYIAYVT